VQWALLLFLIQLIFNAAWTFLFFGLHWPLGGLIDIAILWIMILLTMTAFKDVSRTATILLIPYILWVTFAMALNFELWRLNH
jgi:tryptophan-rich sensory protein